MSTFTRLNRWYDRQPEPRRFLLFFLPFFVVYCATLHPGLWVKGAAILTLVGALLWRMAWIHGWVR